MSGVRAYAPGSVGNVGCGFDVLGLALETPGDTVQARRHDGEGVRIRRITGDDGRLPRNPEENAAGVAARTLIAEAGPEWRDVGVELDLEKGLPLSGGMGGSAASAVAAVVAVDALLELDAPAESLLLAALDGEELASGGRHPDNVAPCLLGGIVLSRPGTRRPVVELPVPEGLSVAILHPRQEVDTRRARAALPGSVPLERAVAQWGDTAALVAALYRDDLELLADSLTDRIAEPARADLVPGFRAVKAAALDAGALGCSLSGAGPAIFALCASAADADEAGGAMAAAHREAVGVGCTLHRSPVGRTGARTLDDGQPEEE